MKPLSCSLSVLNQIFVHFSTWKITTKAADEVGESVKFKFVFVQHKIYDFTKN